MCIVVLIAGQVIVFKIRLFIDKIINSDSKKVEDTEKLRPANNCLLGCLPFGGRFTTSLLCLETQLKGDDFILELFNLCLKARGLLLFLDKCLPQIFT